MSPVILFQSIRGPPLDFQGGGGGRSICRGQIIYFNRARRRAENFTFCYMFIYIYIWGPKIEIHASKVFFYFVPFSAKRDIKFIEDFKESDIWLFRDAQANFQLWHPNSTSKPKMKVLRRFLFSWRRSFWIFSDNYKCSKMTGSHPCSWI